MVRVRSVTYQPVGDELNGGVAMLQAAATLDAAVHLAVESKNIDKLLDIAALWIGVAERLTIEVEEDSEDDNVPIEKRVFGFSSQSKVDEPTKEVVAENAGD